MGYEGGGGLIGGGCVLSIFWYSWYSDIVVDFRV